MNTTFFKCQSMHYTTQIQSSQGCTTFSFIVQLSWLLSIDLEHLKYSWKFYDFGYSVFSCNSLIQAINVSKLQSLNSRKRKEKKTFKFFVLSQNRWSLTQCSECYLKHAISIVVLEGTKNIIVACLIVVSEGSENITVTLWEDIKALIESIFNFKFKK